MEAPPPGGPSPGEVPLHRLLIARTRRLAVGRLGAVQAALRGARGWGRGRRPQAPEWGAPSGARPPSSHGGGRTAAPDAALRAAGVGRAAGALPGQPPRPRADYGPSCVKISAIL
ncbi:synapsin-1-like isoform X2 [Ursus americanus]|uniref:synapsin-1-like isoform X2 n=1 Tax=Ursus americanus TaxID=9643 RepID=UPI001E67B336|nr:synapsin-1-like isoform X2 [Ursus americanus]